MRNLSSFQIPFSVLVPPLAMHRVENGSAEIEITVFWTQAYTGLGGCT